MISVKANPWIVTLIFENTVDVVKASNQVDVVKASNHVDVVKASSPVQITLSYKTLFGPSQLSLSTNIFLAS